MRVAGIDGCRGGWLVVTAEAGRGTAARGLLAMAVAATFAEALRLTAACAAVAVDMPIGLPERGSPGGRRCDVEARAQLGERQSSLFAVPSRHAVSEVDFAAACRAALATSEPPRKVSRQCFNLFVKMREVDGLMSPERQERVRECHPELAFWAMNGGQPLALPKKVRSRPFPDGLRLRQGLLEAAGLPVGGLLAAGLPVAAGGGDDILDAAACAWTAGRIAIGEAIGFPAAAEADGRGLRMQIWA